VRDHSVVYDLGSSTGTTLDLLSSAHAGKENAQLVQLGGVSGDQKPMRAVTACAVHRSQTGSKTVQS